MRTKKLTSRSGMTLLELLIAAGVLMMGFSMLFGALIGMQRASNIVNSRSHATATLRSVTEMIRSLPVNSLIVLEPDIWSVDGVDYQLSIELEDEDGNLNSLPLTVVDNSGQPLLLDDVLAEYPNPIQVRITLGWVVEAEYDGDGNIVGGRAMQVTTRTLIEGSGAVTVPNAS